MRVLFVVRSFVAGGVETTALTLQRQLAEHHCRLAALERYGPLLDLASQVPGVVLPEAEGGTPAQREDLGYFLRAFPRLWGYRQTLRRLLERERPDVLFTHSGLDLLLAARGLWPRWVAGVGSDVLLDARAKHPWIGQALSPLLGWAYRGPDRLLATSRGLGAALTRRWGVRRVDVVGNPVEVRPAGDGPGPDGGEHWLGIGRLAQVKGFDLLIRAAAGGGCPVVLLGEGEERARLAALAEQLGVELRMPGFQPDPRPWMRCSRAVVVSSRLEGFSNVAVEALAAGVPLVVSDCPHGPREIADEGRYAVMFRSGDWRSLQAALREVPGREAELRRLGPCRAAEFAAERVAAQYLELLAEA